MWNNRGKWPRHRHWSTIPSTLYELQQRRGRPSRTRTERRGGRSASMGLLRPIKSKTSSTALSQIQYASYSSVFLQTLSFKTKKNQMNRRDIQFACAHIFRLQNPSSRNHRYTSKPDISESIGTWRLHPLCPALALPILRQPKTTHEILIFLLAVKLLIFRKK